MNRQHALVRVAAIFCAILFGYFLKATLDKYSIEVAISNKNFDASNLQSSRDTQGDEERAKANFLEFFGENEQLEDDVRNTGSDVSEGKINQQEVGTADTQSSSKVHRCINFNSRNTCTGVYSI